MVVVEKEMISSNLNGWISKFGSLQGPRSHRNVKVFIPIYPNTLPTVPKLSRSSRTAPLVVNNLEASQRAITRLLNRCRGQNSYRGFESHPRNRSSKVPTIRGLKRPAI